MNTKPVVSQHDRDALDDLGLVEVLEGAGDGQALHAPELEAS